MVVAPVDESGAPGAGTVSIWPSSTVTPAVSSHLAASGARNARAAACLSVLLPDAVTKSRTRSSGLLPSTGPGGGAASSPPTWRSTCTGELSGTLAHPASAAGGRPARRPGGAGAAMWQSAHAPRWWARTRRWPGGPRALIAHPRRARRRRRAQSPAAASGTDVPTRRAVSRSGPSGSGLDSSTSPSLRGSVSRNTAPLPGSPHACSQPPCSRASSTAMDSPSPVPPVRRARDSSARQKRLNTRLASPGRRPTPWSRTSTATACSSAASTTRTGLASLWSIALATRLRTIRSTRRGSTSA